MHWKKILRAYLKGLRSKSWQIVMSEVKLTGKFVLQGTEPSATFADLILENNMAKMAMVLLKFITLHRFL